MEYNSNLIFNLQNAGYDDDTLRYFVAEYNNGDRGVKNKAVELANRYCDVQDKTLGLSLDEYLISQITNYLLSLNNNEHEKKSNEPNPKLKNKISTPKFNPSSSDSTINPKNPIDIAKLAAQCLTQINENEKDMEFVNIIIAGKTGVGKSTLINAAFREKLAETGIGAPVTQYTQEITSQNMPIRIYDTVGLELTQSTKQSTINEIQKLIQENRGKYKSEIHCMWYCVNANSDRIEKPELELIANVANQNIPVILILTKSYRKKQAQNFVEEIKKLNPAVKNICVLLAQGDEDLNIEAYGMNGLLIATANILPESALTSFINAQSSVELKNTQAMEIVNQTVAAAFGAGFMPVPIADIFMLIPIQITMFTRITSVYGIEMTRNKMKRILFIMFGALGTAYAGQFLAKYLLKFVPFLNVAGDVINAATASAMTYAFGRTYIYIMEMLYTGEMNEEDLDSEEGKQSIKNILQENMKKAYDKINIFSSKDDKKDSPLDRAERTGRTESKKKSKLSYKIITDNLPKIISKDEENKPTENKKRSLFSRIFGKD